MFDDSISADDLNRSRRDALARSLARKRSAFFGHDGKERRRDRVSGRGETRGEEEEEEEEEAYRKMSSFPLFWDWTGGGEVGWTDSVNSSSSSFFSVCPHPASCSIWTINKFH